MNYMLVKLALSGHASPEALSKFERIKAYVPDSAPVLVTYFNKQVLLSDLLVNFSNFYHRSKSQKIKTCWLRLEEMKHL